MGEFSTFLFARSTFLEGVGRVVDLGNTMTVYNTSPSAELADTRALLADRLALAMDSMTARGGDYVEEKSTSK
jgi:hypothetical protein